MVTTILQTPPLNVSKRLVIAHIPVGIRSNLLAIETASNSPTGIHWDRFYEKLEISLILPQPLDDFTALLLQCDPIAMDAVRDVLEKGE